MSRNKNKNWIVNFCYKIHAKLRLQKINSILAIFLLWLGQDPKRTFGSSGEKIKKKNKFVLTYMSCFVMRDFKIPH